MHRSSTIYKLKQYKTALNKYVGGFWCERTTEDGLFHWRKHYYRLWMHILAGSEGLKLNTLMMDFFQLLSSPDVNWWTGVLWITCGLLWCFYQLFGLSFWWHPFTAEHPLLRQWCNATFLQICSDQETNSSTSWMARWWVNVHLRDIGHILPSSLFKLDIIHGSRYTRHSCMSFSLKEEKDRDL